jgi:ketosteroid isomerase-like protein
MSQDNVEIVRASHEAFDQADPARAFAHVHPELVTTRVDPDGAMFHGHEGFLQALAEWVEDFEEWSYSSDEYIDAGDRVVVRVHQSGRGQASGVQVEADFWFVYTMAERQITRLDIYANREQALEAVGLRE